MREKPRSQEIYRHFKGNLYQIITLARDAETERETVVYQALYGDFRVWCRDLAAFLSEVDREKYPDARAKYRFTRVEAVEKRTADGGSAAEVPTLTGGADFAGPSTGAGSAEATGTPERKAGGAPDVRGNVMSKTIEEEAAELGMDPLVVAFLDADSAAKRIRVLEELRGRATNEMIDIMAMAAGLDIEPGEPWDRFAELRDCLRTIERFETSRLRD